MRLGIADDIGRAYVNLADIEYVAGDAQRAFETSLTAMATAAEYGIANSYGVYIGVGAVSFAFECGRWAEAARILAEVDRSGAQQDLPIYRAGYVIEFAGVSRRPGFRRALGRTQRTQIDNQAKIADGWIFQGGIEHFAFAGDFDEACRITTEGIEGDQPRQALSSVPAALRESRPGRWLKLGRRARVEGDGFDAISARSTGSWRCHGSGPTRTLSSSPAWRGCSPSISHRSRPSGTACSAPRHRRHGMRWPMDGRSWVAHSGRPWHAGARPS